MYNLAEGWIVLTICFFRGGLSILTNCESSPVELLECQTNFYSQIMLRSQIVMTDRTECTSVAIIIMDQFSIIKGTT